MLDQLLRAADQAGRTVLQIRQRGFVIGAPSEIRRIDAVERGVSGTVHHTRDRGVECGDLGRSGLLGPRAQGGERSLGRIPIRCL